MDVKFGRTHRREKAPRHQDLETKRQDSTSRESGRKRKIWFLSSHLAPPTHMRQNLSGEMTGQVRLVGVRGPVVRSLAFALIQPVFDFYTLERLVLVLIPVLVAHTRHARGGTGIPSSAGRGIRMARDEGPFRRSGRQFLQCGETSERLLSERYMF